MAEGAGTGRQVNKGDGFSDIQIEDPYNFLNAQEREAYLHAQEQEKTKARASDEARQREEARLKEERLAEEQRRARSLEEERRRRYNEMPPDQRRRMKQETDDPLGERRLPPAYGSQPKGRQMQADRGPYRQQGSAQAADTRKPPVRGQMSRPMNGGRRPVRQQAGYAKAARPMSGIRNARIKEDAEDQRMRRMVRTASTITGSLILLILIIMAVLVGSRYIRGRQDEASQKVLYNENEGESFSGFDAVDETVEVTGTDQLNLRTAPDQKDSGNIFGKVSGGTTMKRTGVNKESNWSRVEYQGETLYAYSDYLKVEE